MTPHRKKLIEVSLPLEAINAACAREKSIRHGHPSTLHLWWARRPLAAARAVIFAQMVDDPASVPEEFPTPEAQEAERQRLFRLIEELVKWENTTNEPLLEKARAEIRRSWARYAGSAGILPATHEAGGTPALPAFHDPFAGGGALPLEAQRLGLEAHASDLNPVAVLINKAMIEIPPRFAGKPPVNPEARQDTQLVARQWRGAQGLAEDVRHYGQWMRDEAEKRIGHLYPKVKVIRETNGTYRHATPEEWAEEMKKPAGSRRSQELTVIAWLWARTVKSPNPAFRDVDVPLASTFMLSTKPGKEAYVEPVIEPGCAGVPPAYRFTVKIGKPEDAEAAKNGTKLGRGANFRCLMSGTPIAGNYIKDEGRAGRMGARLMAIVAEGENGRVYLPPTPEHEAAARQAKPEWRPENELIGKCRDQLPLYGMNTFADLFTPRQLMALTTFSDLVGEAIERVKRDALGARASRPHFPTGWHSRGYHPHFDQPDLVQSVTFRLHDSVPESLLQRWRDEMGITAGVAADDERMAKLRRLIDQYEDAGYGACYLRSPEIAELVESALLHFDGERYRLLEWCIMPNHVHVLLQTVPGHALGDVVQSWKSFTAKKANQMLGRTGTFWMADYYDRFVRDECHLEAVRKYIRENPVKAGLCDRPESWPWSSAAREREDDVALGSQAPSSLTQAGETPAHPGDDDRPLRDGGSGPHAYAEAVGVYLGFAVDKGANYWSAICAWSLSTEKMISTFGRQAIPMIWDYCEANPLSTSSGNWTLGVEQAAKMIEALGIGAPGSASQADAALQSTSADKLISTDPPYYDNIGYADLSDFFYVWLRRTLQPVFPDLFATLAVPKAEELVATPYRHGGKEAAEKFFLGGMTQAMHRLAEQAHRAYPVTIYYAFKQSESLGARASGPHDADETSAHPGVTSTGWETFLDAVIRAGFTITGTWPLRTEYTGNLKKDVSALASSIVLVCRPRPANAPTATRREFVTALKAELPQALAHLQAGNIAPVDLAQAAIGPGMAVYTRYAKVLDNEGRPVSVREALALINQTLDEVLAEQEGDFDADSRWALAWFEQHGFSEGEFGVAETLSKAKNTSIEGLVAAGILESRRGKVRLLRPGELPADWDPSKDTRLTVWEMVHHLVRALQTGGELAAAALLAQLGSRGEYARELCYRLYTISERKKRPDDALAYNALVQSWPEITRLAREKSRTRLEQGELLN